MSVFSPLQITVMLLSKLKETAEKGLSIKVVDCVISVSLTSQSTQRTEKPSHVLCVIAGTRWLESVSLRKVVKH